MEWSIVRQGICSNKAHKKCLSEQDKPSGFFAQLEVAGLYSILSLPPLSLPSLPPPLPRSGPLESAWGLGSAVSSPSGSGRSPAAKRFWCLLSAEKWLMLVLNIHYFILVIQL
jgi:hypothetical protein